MEEEVKHILPCANQICRLALTSPVTVEIFFFELANYESNHPPMICLSGRP